MLLKGKGLIVLLLSKTTGFRHPAERQSAILRKAQDDIATGGAGGQPPCDTLSRIGYRQCQVRR